LNYVIWKPINLPTFLPFIFGHCEYLYKGTDLFLGGLYQN
jgi:hypothetical protein